MEGLIDSEGEGEGEEGEGEGSGSDDEMPPNKRPVLAENKKTLQQRRRQRERREKVSHSLHVGKDRELLPIITWAVSGCRRGRDRS